MVCAAWWPGFRNYFLKADLWLQNYSTAAFLACFALMYNHILIIHQFVKDNEMRQKGWKFDQLKHALQIDEQTFSFDLINIDGILD